MNDTLVVGDSPKYLNDSRVKWIYENLYSKSKQFKVDLMNDKVIIHGDIFVPGMYDKILYKIDEVYGNVIVDNINEPPTFGNIKSLENFPTIIHGNFICKLNPHLISLKGGPEIVDGDFICVGCGLKDLNYMPKIIGGNLVVYNNNISILTPIFESNISGSIDVQFNPCTNDKVYQQLLKTHKLAYT